MKMQATIIIILIAIVLVSVTALGTFSFAVRTNSTGTGTQHNNSTASSSPPSKIPHITPSKITTTIPVAHNVHTTLRSGGTGPCAGGDTKFYWDHVYDVNNGQPWGRNPGRLDTKDLCVTVTGTVYSKVGGGTSHDSQGDGDLHFTLALDPASAKYSVPNDCNPSKTGCTNIIVEVICHTTPTGVYAKSGKWGDYCGGVDRTRIPLSGIMPSQGERLSVSGRLVFDKDGGWNEIHPAIDVHKP
jgi:hypothetical protein